MMITEGLVEQHIHGAFGIDFMTCSIEQMEEIAQKLALYGVAAFFPTIMTDDINIIKERIAVIKKASEKKIDKAAQIAGVHLEGPFINKEKAGIHQKKFIQPLDINVFKQLEDEIIKIVTLAPELDKNGDFINYLKSKNIKVAAGHTIATDLSNVNMVTHLYNAMANFHHRNPSTIVNALINEELYVEIIADSIHICDDVLKITFKQKNIEKILLISDALPLAHSDKKEGIFSGQTIYNKNGNLIGKDGTIAGSSMLLCDIVKNVLNKKLLEKNDVIKAVSTNQLKYHNLKNNLRVHWNKKNQIDGVDFLSFI